MNSSFQPPYDPMEELFRQNLGEYPWNFREHDWQKLEKKLKETEENRLRSWFAQQAQHFLNMFHFFMSLLSIPVTSFV